MRRLSDGLTSLLQEQTGLRPWQYIVLTLGGETYRYGQDTITSPTPSRDGSISISDLDVPEGDIQPRLISVGAIDQSLGDGTNFALSSVSVVLDDGDGALKEAFDTSVIGADSSCEVWQVISHGVPEVHTKFPIYEGKIIGPVAYDESRKTLSFSVEGIPVSEVAGTQFQLDDITIPKELAGSLIPLAYGINLRRKLTSLVSAISTTTTEPLIFSSESVRVDLVDFPTGVDDDPPPVLDLLIGDIRCKGTYSAGVITFSPTEAKNLDLYTGLLTSANLGADPAVLYIADIPATSTDPAYTPNIRNSYVLASIGSVPEPVVNYCVNQVGNKCVFIKPWRKISLTGFPTPNIVVPANIAVRAARFPRTVWGTTYRDEYATDGLTVLTIDMVPDDFNYAAGTSVRLYSNGETGFDYMLTAGQVEDPILEVLAYRETPEGTRILAPVPESRFKLTTKSYNGTPCSILRFMTPLSSYLGEGWEDEIYCSFKSLNADGDQDAASIVRDLLTKFSSIVPDNITFNILKTNVSKYPLGFTITSEQDTLTLVTDILRQVCAGYLIRNSKMFPKLLAKAPSTTTSTLNNSTVASGSVTLGCTDTVDIVTAYTGTYSLTDVETSVVSEFEYKNNIGLFGKHELTESFWCHNEIARVRRCIAWHGYRKSNIYYKVTCIGFLGFIPIEVFDIVSATGEITGGSSSVYCEVTGVNYTGYEVQVSGTLASKAGENYAYDSSFFEGPDGYAYDYSDSVVDVSAGLELIDYIPSATSTDNGPPYRDGTNTGYSFIFETLPAVIKRGEQFTIVVKIKNSHNRVMGISSEYPLSIDGGAQDDTLNFTTAIFENGVANIDGCTITGGTGESSVQFKINTSHEPGANPDDYVLSDSVRIDDIGEFKFTMNTAVKRDESVTLTVYGLIPETTYTVAFSCDDGSDVLNLTSGGAFTSVVTNAEGSFVSSVKVTGGTIELAGFNIELTYGTNKHNITHRLVYDIEGGGGGGGFVIVKGIAATGVTAGSAVIRKKVSNAYVEPPEWELATSSIGAYGCALKVESNMVWVLLKGPIKLIGKLKYTKYSPSAIGGWQVGSGKLEMFESDLGYFG